MQKELTDTDRLDIVEDHLEYIVKMCEHHFDNGDDTYAGVLYAEYKEWLEAGEDYIVAWAPDFNN